MALKLRVDFSARARKACKSVWAPCTRNSKGENTTRVRWFGRASVVFLQQLNRRDARRFLLRAIHNVAIQPHNTPLYFPYQFPPPINKYCFDNILNISSPKIQSFNYQFTFQLGSSLNSKNYIYNSDHAC